MINVRLLQNHREVVRVRNNFSDFFFFSSAVDSSYFFLQPTDREEEREHRSSIQHYPKQHSFYSHFVDPEPRDCIPSTTCFITIPHLVFCLLISLYIPSKIFAFLILFFKLIHTAFTNKEQQPQPPFSIIHGSSNH